MKASSTRGVICTPHANATDAGLEILDAGGTAIDAVLAAGATLAVVYPHMTGLGGDALWLLSDGRRVDTLMGIGQAGQRLPEAGHIAERGPASAATTAGALRSWSLAHQWSTHRWRSRLGWQRLLERATMLAEQGYELSESQAFWQNQRRDLIDKLPDLRSFCCDQQGQLLAAGTRQRQPELAHTLRQLASRGVDDFYEGDTADRLSEGFSQLGNGLTRNDLQATRAYHCKPLHIPYGNGRLFNFPPPTQGLYTLRALNALNRLDLAAMGNGSVDYYHCLVEAIKSQLKQRNQELCESTLDTIGSRDWRNDSLDTVDPSQAAPWDETPQPADTVWLAATDSNGHTACLMQSLFHDFGSGCHVGDTGVLWQNRAASFSTDPGHPNAWAPGKRPAHTLNPSCYLADDGRQIYFGTQGGDGQPQTQMVLATQLIDFNQSVEQALGAPRFLQGRSFFGSSNNLKLERGMASAVGEALQGRGHAIEWIDHQSPLCGQAGVIMVAADGKREAMHDPRGGGTSRRQQ